MSNKRFRHLCVYVIILGFILWRTFMPSQIAYPNNHVYQALVACNSVSKPTFMQDQVVQNNHVVEDLREPFTNALKGESFQHVVDDFHELHGVMTERIDPQHPINLQYDPHGHYESGKDYWFGLNWWRTIRHLAIPQSPYVKYFDLWVEVHYASESEYTIVHATILNKDTPF